MAKKKEDFNAEEWNLLRAAPVLVMTGVAASDPGGLVGAFKEAYNGGEQHDGIL